MLVLGGVTFKKDQPRIVGIENRSDGSGMYMKSNSSPLKNDGWKTILPFWNGPFSRDIR